MSNACEFDIEGVCYAPKCFDDSNKCSAKDINGYITFASDAQIKEKRETEMAMPKLTIMQPTVVNISNPPSENVASEGFDTEQSVILPKI